MTSTPSPTTTLDNRLVDYIPADECTPVGAANWLRSRHPHLDQLVTDLERLWTDIGWDQGWDTWTDQLSASFCALHDEMHISDRWHPVLDFLDSISDYDRASLRCLAALGDCHVLWRADDLAYTSKVFSQDWVHALTVIAPHRTSTLHTA